MEDPAATTPEIFQIRVNSYLMASLEQEKVAVIVISQFYLEIFMI
jgi:hypothetical protein